MSTLKFVTLPLKLHFTQTQKSPQPDPFMMNGDGKDDVGIPAAFLYQQDGFKLIEMVQSSATPVKVSIGEFAAFFLSLFFFFFFYAHAFH